MILRICSALSFVFLSRKILTMWPFSVSNVSPSFRNFSSASFSVKWLPKVAMTTARLFFFRPSRTAVFLNPSASPYAILCLTWRWGVDLLYGYLYEATLATRLLSKHPSELYLDRLPLRPLAAVPSFYLLSPVFASEQFESVFEFFGN